MKDMVLCGPRWAIGVYGYLASRYFQEKASWTQQQKREELPQEEVSLSVSVGMSLLLTSGI